MHIGFLGLGQMGRPMALRLVEAGHDVIVYNRTRERAEEVAKSGARVADTPSGAAASAQVLVTMLSDDSAVEAVVFAKDGALVSLPRGAVHASMSTISLDLSRRLARAHAEAGHGYVAAPVFGRPEAAEAKQLWILAGGATESIERCRPVFDALGQGVIEIGDDPAKANVTKLAGNFLLAAAIEAMAEAFALVRKHGVEPARFLEVANGKVIRSPVYEAYGGLIAAERYLPAGFKLRHGLKDMRLALAASDEVAAPLPLAGLVRDHYLSAVARGGADLDWAALGLVAAENAGLR
jgi:3-hydroxyisobutyrate dehydrogenase-like beta-hydroxyacid dehydrogenase